MCVIRMAGARGLGQARWPEVEQVDRRPGPHPGECPVPASGLGNLSREGTGQEPESLLDTPLKQRKKVKSSKYGKLSSGHRTGKDQFSLQSPKKAIPRNV